MILSVVYQVGPDQRFDLDYYLGTHMPLVQCLFGPEGLKGTQVLQGVGTPGGTPAGYQVIAMLDFASVDAFKTAAHGAKVFGDIANFTDVQPLLQFNERLL